ncbi:50S ribosome-binding GTPase [Treponema sp. OMZ 787]|uniref:GTPase family protein n=1 Tax=Treponema sp. OMZ 787 TaxID=2563669 RepID=UPI0020A5568C|nr:GTPase [Treponema sp. OMZ 787]UTC63331.1 50S ribosome-binding GTPase [Treponema sp. OMZ 787]
MKSIQEVFDRIEQKFGTDMSKVKNIVSEEENKPLVAAVFGQTGTGKSSLTNALFGTKFKVDDTRPCTKEPQKHIEKGADGKKVTFWDLPGLGESDSADDKYICQYADIAKTCDVILWVFQADTRSILIDKQALKKITDKLEENEKIKFLSKITVVLTKSDTVASDSWLFAKNDNTLITAPGKETEKLLDEKALYFYMELFSGYEDLLIHRINLNSECKEPIKFHSNLWIDVENQKIVQKGKIFDSDWKSIIKKNDKYKEELTELYKSQRGIICSVRYNYNLNEVKYRIVNRTEGMSILRMVNKINAEIPEFKWNTVKKLNIPIIYDIKSKKYLFSAETL